jgi:tetratricopeptide (TPR) repeat protein
MDPNYAEAHFSLGMTYALLGRYAEAIAEYRTALSLSGNRQIVQAMLGLAHARAGHPEETQRIYDDLLAQAKTGHVSSYHFGILAMGLGKEDDAMRFFEKAYEERDGIIIYLPIDPVGESLWPDPRFVALARKMGLK